MSGGLDELRAAFATAEAARVEADRLVADADAALAAARQRDRRRRPIVLEAIDQLREATFAQLECRRVERRARYVLTQAENADQARQVEAARPSPLVQLLRVVNRPVRNALCAAVERGDLRLPEDAVEELRRPATMGRT